MYMIHTLISLPICIYNYIPNRHISFYLCKHFILVNWLGVIFIKESFWCLFCNTKGKNITSSYVYTNYLCLCNYHLVTISKKTQAVPEIINGASVSRMCPPVSCRCPASLPWHNTPSKHLLQRTHMSGPRVNFEKYFVPRIRQEACSLGFTSGNKKGVGDV